MKAVTFLIIVRWHMGLEEFLKIILGRFIIGKANPVNYPQSKVYLKRIIHSVLLSDERQLEFPPDDN